MYGSETLLWKEKGRSRVRAVQRMTSEDYWVLIRRMDRVPNTRVRELCGVRKVLD